jgi:PAS domain S-box-containing protein
MNCCSEKINEHRLALGALAWSEKTYRDLLNQSIQPMFQSSVSGELLTANQVFVKMLGFTSLNEFQGINVASLFVNPKDRETYTEMMMIKGYCILSYR